MSLVECHPKTRQATVSQAQEVTNLHQHHCTVLGQSHDVQPHLITQLHTLHIALHSPHQCPGLLTFKSLVSET